MKNKENKIMRAKEVAIINDCHSFLSEVCKGIESKLTAIYYRTKKSDAVDIKAYAVLDTHPLKAVEFNPYKDTKLHKCDYIVNHDFEVLSDGFEILYMPLEKHKNIWLEISNKVPQNSEGLQKYLLYCKQHGITKDVIDSISTNNIKDAMNMYHEKNDNYEIISTMNIDDTSIVIGHNPNAPQPYVVWDCDIHRKYGYRNGSYRSVKEDAEDIFKRRCKEHMDKALHLKISSFQSKKEKNHYER